MGDENGNSSYQSVNWSKVCVAIGFFLYCTAESLAGQCDLRLGNEQIGKVIAAEGKSEIWRLHPAEAKPVKLEQAVYFDTQVSTESGGRVSIVLEHPDARKANDNKPIVTLGPHSSLNFQCVQKDKPWWLQLGKGWLRFFSPRPSNVAVDAPYLTAGVKGTEFVLHGQQNSCEELDEQNGCTVLWVQKGTVVAKNGHGSINVNSDQTVIAKLNIKPALIRTLKIKPKDAVNWTIYYPPLVDLQLNDCKTETSDTTQIGKIRRQIVCGNLEAVIEALQKIPDLPSTTDTHELYGLGVTRLLAAGEVDEAEDVLKKALTRSPSAPLYALQSIIALKQNDKNAAQDAVDQSLNLDKDSPISNLALSYVRQAQFDLEAARDAVKKAAEKAPDDVLIKARQAELELSLGNPKLALDLAEQAVGDGYKNSSWTEGMIRECTIGAHPLSAVPDAALERALTMLGFTHLIQYDVAIAGSTFQAAICANDYAALPRLGLGLVKIRQGDLDAGVRQLEIAASLDPAVSIYRSYLGKGYFEQHRYDLAAKELNIAKEFDKKDPTPWLYDAFRAQAENKPIVALENILDSIAKNDNRAVYRSRLLLDGDNAARNVSLGRVYQELGFDQLVLPSAAESLALDPQNSSVHLFLADAYQQRPRHEISRVSETLQAQIRQPLAQALSDARLGEARLVDFSALSGIEASFSEYTQLFLRDGVNTLLASRVAGNDTFENQVSLSVLEGPIAISLSQFHFETDGFRKNNEREQDYWNVLLHYQISPKSSIQFEYRTLDDEHGEAFLGFDPEDFFPSDTSEDVRSWRVGAHHRISNTWEIITSYRKEDANRSFALQNGFLDWYIEESGKQAEIQLAGQVSSYNLVTGGSYFSGERIIEQNIFFRPLLRQSNPHHTNAYAYSSLPWSIKNETQQNMPWSQGIVTLGLSYDEVKDGIAEDNQYELNPKVGLTQGVGGYAINPTVRLAYYETMKRALLANQTLEPTTVAGFSQFFDDGEGAKSKVKAAALDFSKSDKKVFAGIEWMHREIDVPIFVFGSPSGRREDISESIKRAYLYWIPDSSYSINLSYQQEIFDRNAQAFGPERIIDSETDRLFLKYNYFHDSGFRFSIKPQWIRQKGTFADSFDRPKSPQRSSFYVVDTSIGYKLPNRTGLVSLSVSNLFDRTFRYQDTDPFNTTIAPERFISLTGVLSFNF